MVSEKIRKEIEEVYKDKNYIPPLIYRPERSKREDFEFLATQFLEQNISDRGGNWETENGYILGVNILSG